MASFLSRQKLGFLCHLAVELPASCKFVLIPSSGLPGKAGPEAEAIIRQYGVLLFVSVIVSAIFLSRSHDATSCHVSLALAIYHFAPMTRAIRRIMQEKRVDKTQSDLGGPWVHLCAHILCFVTLVLPIFIE